MAGRCFWVLVQCLFLEVALGAWLPTVTSGSISAPPLLPAFVPAFTDQLAGLKVFVPAGDDTVWHGDVVNKLTATGLFSTVVGFDLFLGTPTLAEMMQYDVFLTWTDNEPNDGDAFTANLVACMNAGKGVVAAVFAVSNVPFATPTYSVWAPWELLQQGNQQDGIQAYLGAVVDATHPVMAGINNFDGGSKSYRGTTNATSNGATILAYWSDGIPLVAVGILGPANTRRVDLNFFPVSADARSDLWVPSTQGAQLMANALMWAGTNPSPSTSVSPSPSLTASPSASVGASPAASGTTAQILVRVSTEVAANVTETTLKQKIGATGSITVVSHSVGQPRRLEPVTHAIRASCLLAPFTDTVTLRFSDVSDITKLAALIQTGDPLVTSADFCVARLSSSPTNAVQPSPVSTVTVSDSERIPIGLGVGLGVGLPLVITTLLLAFCCCLKPAPTVVLPAAHSTDETSCTSYSKETSGGDEADEDD